MRPFSVIALGVAAAMLMPASASSQGGKFPDLGPPLKMNSPQVLVGPPGCTVYKIVGPAIAGALESLVANPKCGTLPLPACAYTWKHRNTVDLPSDVWRPIWAEFFSQQQFDLIAAARASALARRPPGRTLYRLKFATEGSTGPNPHFRLKAQAWFGVCGQPD